MIPLSTTLPRADADGHTGDCSITVWASVASHIPAIPPTRNDPGEAASYEFAFEGAEFADGEPDDCPGPLTDDEKRVLLAWLVSDAGHRAACEAAADQVGDAGRDPDEARDRAWDDLGERWAA